MKETVGIRLTNGQIPGIPGEYAFFPRQNGENDWLVYPPKEGLGVGTLQKHTVNEHEDKTITVDREIIYNSNYPERPQWRGKLIRGVWIEC
jgi:hypothetical protein